MRLGALPPAVTPATASPSGAPVATITTTTGGITAPTTTALPMAAPPTAAAPLSTTTAATADSVTASSSLPELAATLGLPPGDAAAAVVTALIRDGLPLMPEVAQRVLTLWRATDLPSPAAAALLWLGERRIPATPERVRLIQAFRAADPGSDGPQPGTLLLSARLTPDQPPVVTAWPWLQPQPHHYPQQPPATLEPPPDRPSAIAADDSASAQPTVATRVALLLSVATERFGPVEALVATAGEQVDVTFFSDQPAAVAALSDELSTLSAALTAAGLLPADLAAHLATATSATAADGAPGLTRLDVRV